MKLYGLFKVINKNIKNLDIELFNLLHPENKLNDPSSFDIESKTFFNFFYEDNPVILKADIDFQYIEYNKFKRELEQMAYKKNISQYEKDIIGKMLQKLIIAENKFCKYQKEVSIIDKADIRNRDVIENLFQSQPIFAKNIYNYLEMYYNFIDLNENEIPDNLKLLFDTEYVDANNYEDTIMYPNNVISYYRTGVKFDDSKIILDNDNRVQYIVFELEPNESIKLNTTEENTAKINKLKRISELCNEMNIPIPNEVISKLNSISRCIWFKYKEKNLLIYTVEKDEQEIIYTYSKS